MAASAIQRELLKYFVQLNDEEKESVLLLLKTFVNGRKQPAEQITLEQYNREIDEALAEIERGDVYTHEEVEKMSKDW